MHLSDVLRRAVDQPAYRKAKTYSVFWLWKELVGPALAKRSEPTRVQDGILFVTVDDAVWANELFLWRTRILADIRKAVGPKKIRDIRFSVGTRAVRRTRKHREGAPTFPALREDAIHFDEVEDAELKGALEALYHHASQVGTVKP